MVIAERLPPFDVEAEEAILASLMVDGEAIYKVQGILHPQDFYRDQHRWTYEACLALWERGESINQVTVAHEMDRREQLEDAGGHGFLSRLIVELPTSIGVEHYAGIVSRDAAYRQLIGASTQITNLAYQGGPDLDAVLGRAEALILALRAGDQVRDFV
ncbi:MAG: replicative DNA helicase, partial [Chloroflexi bacterium]|nr:replicative DNA helicase [Chloroflexota bacterium]